MQKRETKWQRMEASAVGTSKAHLANSLVLLVTAGAVLTLLLAYLFGTPLWVAALAFAYWVGVLRLGVWIGGKFTVTQQARREELSSQRDAIADLEMRRETAEMLTELNEEELLHLIVAGLRSSFSDADRRLQEFDRLREQGVLPGVSEEMYRNVRSQLLV